ncbi:TonB-dependent receptor [Asticcacaulis sp. BYS171W]|uniref:TonB-dependent receptor n=1 Tax=Asticcacaulis aquaticus TaxID=2984212 RepID=A0ABT5HRI5_9CAUL|nr:TonB-dependent receptor [Asticcacaulis aquaticus]MDC7682678.1 TonB-dependent receptor [Asticcacaulis aquaticus]
MKSSTSMILTVVSASLVMPAMAQAQTAAPTAAQTDVKTEKDKVQDKADPTTVTVKGQRKEMSGDKEVYDVTKNPDALTGTAQDALNKVPGVNVDNDGNVTVRGREARVFVNGRPALYMTGDNRGAALQSMPSASISSIEVISNPGAQYSSSSNEPIVNIVTKRNMPPGVFGSVSGQVLSNEGASGNTFLSLAKDKLTLTAMGSLNRSIQNSISDSQTQGFDASGNRTRESRRNGLTDGAYSRAFLSTSLQYDLGPNDVLTGGLTYTGSASDTDSLSASTTFNAGGAATDIFTSLSESTSDQQNGTLSAGYTHYGQKPDQSFKLDMSLSRSENENDSDTITSYDLSSTGSRLPRPDRKLRDGSNNAAMVQAAYNTTLGRTQVSVGTQINQDDNRANSLSYGPDTAGTGLVLQPLLTSDLRYEQTASAVYVTAQRQFGAKWTLLGGLRAEFLDMETHETRSNTRNQVDYARLNPSLFATYALSKDRKIRLSYTHKQQRPSPNDLNPRLVYISDTSVSVGNTDLGPQESDNFEASYEVSNPTGSYAVRGFWRTDDDMIVSTSRIIADPQNLGNVVTQSMRVNGGYQSQKGVTLSYSKRTKKLNLNLDATVTFVDMEGPNIVGTQSEVTFGGSVMATYTLKNNDTVSINYRLQPRRYTGNGYSDSSAFNSISYRHRLTPKMWLNFTVQDPFRTPRSTGVTEGPLLRSRYSSEREARVMMIGLSRSFGGFTPTAAPVPVKKP